MKYLSTIILLLISSWLGAQQLSYATLDSLIDTNLKDYNYELAEEYSAILEFKALNEYGAYHPRYQKALEQQIRTYQVLGRPREAMLMAQEALEIQQHLSFGKKDISYYHYLDRLIRTHFNACLPSKDILINDLWATYQALYPDLKDYQYWNIAANLADWYYCNAQYKKALRLYKQVQAFNQGYSRELGMTYKALGHYSKALEAFQPLLETTLDYELKDVLVEIYEHLGDSLKAKELTVEIEQGYLPVEISFEVLDSLMRVNRFQLNYDMAVRYAEIKEEKALEVYDAFHPVYQEALLDLAFMYGFIRRYEEATLLCWEVLEIQERQLSLGKKDQAYLDKVKTILGKNYQGERAPDKDVFLNEAMAVYEQLNKDTESSIYLDWKDKLGKWYFAQGKYNKAVKTYEELVVVDQKYAVSLSRAYLRLGRYEEAEVVLKKIEEDRFGKDLVLIEVYKATAQHEKLLALCKKIIKKYPFQKDRLLTTMGASYTALGYTYYAQNTYTKALELYQELPAFEQTLDSTKGLMMVGEDIYKVGLLYSNLGQFDEAKRWFEKVLKIYPSTYTEHRNALRELFLQSWKQKNYVLADSLMLEMNKNTTYLLEEYYPKLSEEKRLDFYRTVEQDIELCYSYASQQKDLDSTMALAVQELSLVTKNLSLQNSERFLSLVLADQDTTLVGVYYEWLAIRRRIVEALAMSEEMLAMQKIDLDQLWSLADKKEQELSLRSAAVEKTLKKQTTVVTTSTLKKKLKKQELSVDFLSFREYEKGQWSTDIFYYALVLKKDWKQPKLIKLTSQQKLNIFLEKEVSRVGQNYIADVSFSGALYMLLWLKLEPYLADVKTVHLCPTRLLNKLAFGSLRNPLNNKRLIEEYAIHYYGNLRDFVLDKTVSNTNQITLFGGINFYGDIAPEADDFNPRKRDFTRGYPFNLLGGTYRETKSIDLLFEQAGWSPKWYIDNQASEAQFRSLLSSDSPPNILHIATHGFFFTESNVENKQFTPIIRNLYQSTNPLFRSGLAFAGVNKVWVDGEYVDSENDGVLTAYEVASLDLYQTDLVVLSACETGRGDIDKNEGVMGLQRAFKLAGAEQLIISLWKVPDAQTAKLMETFYEYYLEGLSIPKAFRQAQLELRREHPNPYYWAAFILME